MKRERIVDLVILGLLAAAVAQAVGLLAEGGSLRAYVPLLGPNESTMALQAPGGAERALAARSAAVGEFVTVEDLARGVLALRDGTLPGAPPLSESERAALEPLLTKANADRTELLRVEGEIATVQAELQDRARAIAATLTPEQRAWIVANRDQVSVGQVEQAYWDELLGAAPGAGAPGAGDAPR